MKLNNIEMPEISFRAELPEYLNGLTADGSTAWISVEARPGGDANPALGMALEKLRIKAMKMDKRHNDVDDPDQSADLLASDLEKIQAEKLRIIYENCVVSWKTNIVDNGEPIAPTMENFVALDAVGFQPIRAAFDDLIEEIGRVGQEMVKEDNETAKN